MCTCRYLHCVLGQLIDGRNKTFNNCNLTWSMAPEYVLLLFRQNRTGLCLPKWIKYSQLRVSAWELNFANGIDQNVDVWNKNHLNQPRALIVFFIHFILAFLKRTSWKTLLSCRHNVQCTHYSCNVWFHLKAFDTKLMAGQPKQIRHEYVQCTLYV